MDTQSRIAELERTAAVHEATRAELQAAPWNRRKEAQLRDLARLAFACRREADRLRGGGRRRSAMITPTVAETLIWRLPWYR